MFPIVVIYALFNLYQHLNPFYLGENAKGETSNFKIASINIFSQNQTFEDLKKYVESEKFDVLILQELTPRWQQNVSFIRKDYPYYHEEVRDNNFGIAIYSKIKLDEVLVKNYIDEMHPSLLASLTINNQTVKILGTHPVPPIPNNARFKKRNEQYVLMRKEIDALTDEHIIFIGDFNSTVFSPNFEKVKSEKLKDARSGFGLQNSWNAYFPIMRTNIDQIWVSKNIKVTNFYRGEHIDSDHFPIVAELKID